jgi:hypothetical protein
VIPFFIMMTSMAFSLNSEVRIAKNPNTCEEGTLIYMEMMGEISRREHGQFCFDSSFSNIISKSCSKKCGLVDRAKADKKYLDYSQIGTPGSWLCKRYGGESRVIILETKDLRQTKQNFCLRGRDVVSTPYLLQLKGKGN